jgi:SAM-dependent methyltransferase
LTSAASAPQIAAGSFRDPQGQVVEFGTSVFRALHAPLAPFPETWADGGPLAGLVAAKKLLPGRPLSVDAAPAAVREFVPRAVGFLEHPRLDLITYPYEWPFALLKRAALLHLDLHREALSCGFTLTDGSAYNIQFIGVDPIFIDSLAFVPYRDGQPWAGYAQFCESFLNPLLMAARGSLSVNDIYRARLRGVATREVARQLGWRGALRTGTFIHVIVNSLMQTPAQNTGSQRRSHSTRGGLELLLRSLRRAIDRLELPRDQRDWSSYEIHNSYSESDRMAKATAVRDFVGRLRPKLLLDLGCNAGEYSEIALEEGAKQVLGLERDAGAANRAVVRAQGLKRPFLPLQVDIQNPSPAQGFDLAERRSLVDRVKPDAVLCLALLHHLVIGEGVPLPAALRAIIGLAPRGLIEFVPPDDPMSKRIAGPAERLRHPYDLATFEAELARLADLGQRTELTSTGRLLVEYSRRI